MTHEAERFYGRRKGRSLRPGRQRLIDNLLPKLAIPMDNGIDGPIDPASLFSRSPRQIWLEIGFGNGEHLAWQAAENPDIGLIGCEPFVNGVSTLLSEIDTRNLGNIRLHADDARPLLDRLPDACLSRVFVLFPDPWPKKRHWNRRFIGPGNLDRLSRIMVTGGELRIGSDHPEYVAWILRHSLRHPGFEWIAERPDDWRRRPADWPPTRYETKSLAGPPVYLSFLRKQAVAGLCFGRR